jgi:hypothetical protein
MRLSADRTTVDDPFSAEARAATGGCLAAAVGLIAADVLLGEYQILPLAVCLLLGAGALLVVPREHVVLFSAENRTITVKARRMFSARDGGAVIEQVAAERVTSVEIAGDAAVPFGRRVGRLLFARVAAAVADPLAAGADAAAADGAAGGAVVPLFVLDDGVEEGPVLRDWTAFLAPRSLVSVAP